MLGLFLLFLLAKEFEIDKVKGEGGKNDQPKLCENSLWFMRFERVFNTLRVNYFVVEKS
jgi:hypothetical protein